MFKKGCQIIFKMTPEAVRSGGARIPDGRFRPAVLDGQLGRALQQPGSDGGEERPRDDQRRATICFPHPGREIRIQSY
jgi:hypothetical protein